MIITVVSLAFLPDIGGLENIMAGLAVEWSSSNEVTVFTNVKDDSYDSQYSFKIIRKFSIIKLWNSVKRSDILIEANLSFKTVLVGLLYKKKWIVIHHGIYDQNTLNGKIKKKIMYFSNNIAVSQYVASEIQIKTVIPNFYNLIFKPIFNLSIKKDLVFIGRLVSDKGVDLVLQVIYNLKIKGIHCNLSIIGVGPEETKLKNFSNVLDISDQVFFWGAVKGQSLVEKINEHKVVVIPSRWKEPFGIVALEGLACGCKVVCPDEGGLQEAAGGFAFLYKHNDINSLEDAILLALSKVNSKEEDFLITNYLKKFSSKKIANIYLNYFSTLTNKSV
jgi:glycogen(starch) synthase